LEGDGAVPIGRSVVSEDRRHLPKECFRAKSSGVAVI
jgi:hypothetical protein